MNTGKTPIIKLEMTHVGAQESRSGQQSNNKNKPDIKTKGIISRSVQMASPTKYPQHAYIR